MALGRSSSSASGGFRRSLSISSRGAFSRTALGNYTERSEASLDIPEPSNHLTTHSPLTPSTPAVEEDDESEDEHHETATLMGTMKYAYQASSEDEISVDGTSRVALPASSSAQSIPSFRSLNSTMVQVGSKFALEMLDAKDSYLHLT